MSLGGGEGEVRMGLASYVRLRLCGYWISGKTTQQMKGNHAHQDKSRANRGGLYRLAVLMQRCARTH